jgi:hypothetical protein
MIQGTRSHWSNDFKFVSSSSVLAKFGLVHIQRMNGSESINFQVGPPATGEAWSLKLEVLDIEAYL